MPSSLLSIMALNSSIPGMLVFGRRRLLNALAPLDGTPGAPGVICPPSTLIDIPCDLDIDISASNTFRLLNLGDEIVIDFALGNTEDDLALQDDITIGFTTVLT